MLRDSSAELKGPRILFWIRPEIFDFEPEFGLKLGRAKPKIPGTVPTGRHATIANDSGPILACFDDDARLLNCEIAQPKKFRGWFSSVIQGTGRSSKLNPMGRANDEVPGMLSLLAWNHTCPLPPQNFIAFPLE